MSVQAPEQNAPGTEVKSGPRSRRHEPINTSASILDRLFLPAIARGLWHTLFAHMLRPTKVFTVQYPEVRRPVRTGYRGEHRLKTDEQGREKCVACFMCSTACPASCIRIVAEPAPWDDRDKHPKIFEIDLLECIYCGMCEEACPCDAIEMTDVYNIVSTTREEKIYDKERLLSN